MTKAPRGLWAALLRLVRLAGALGKSWPEDRYEWFLTQHVDDSDSWDPADPDYCNNMMKCRRINRPKKPPGPKCKSTNTFIHASEDAVLAVCQPEGGTRERRNLYRSKESFDLTVCSRPRPHDEQRCAYEGESSTARVLLACEGRKPVHFEPHTEEEPIALGQSQA